MRSLFWRILGAFWLALILTGALTFLVTRFFNQDSWVLSQHPGLHDLASAWLEAHERTQSKQAQQLLQQARREHRIHTQIFDEDGQLVASSSRIRAAESATQTAYPAAWRRLTQEVTSHEGKHLLFVYRLSSRELAKWQYGRGLGPLTVLIVAVFVLTLVSLLLTLSITRPLTRLRQAVHELGATALQQSHLAQLAQRKDELGVLAADFNKMGQRLQGMLNSQQQLLRDVSHELRSPLARLQVGLALAERGSDSKREALWPKLTLECERLDALINEILVVARLGQDQPTAEAIALHDFLTSLIEDSQVLAPEQSIILTGSEGFTLASSPQVLHRVLDNLMRNALRFNPPAVPITISVTQTEQHLSICIRDQGPGAPAELLSDLTQPFIRAQGQQNNGYGLGLTIAERAVQQLGGRLQLYNHAQGGFVACIELPLTAPARVTS